MNKGKRIGRMVLCLVISFVMIMTLIPRMPSSFAFAALNPEGEPIRTKDLKDNGDGTYKLSLDVLGDSENDPIANKANVVIVLDISGSMNFPSNESGRSTAGNNAIGRYGYNDGEYWRLYYRTGNYGNYTYYPEGDGPQANQRHGTVYRATNIGNNGVITWTAYNGTRYNFTDNTTRLEATKVAVKNLVSTLLAQNAGSVTDMIEISYVTFSSNAHYVIPTSATGNGWVSGTSTTTLNNAVDSTQAAGATNWVQALTYGDNLGDAKTDDDDTYVVFFSDGAPTTGGDNYNGVADTIYRDGYKLYGIFAYGDATDQNRMHTLVSHGNYGNGNHVNDVIGSQSFAASNQEEIEAAFAAIASAIANAVGLDDVSITDGTTSKVSASSDLSLLNVVPNSYDYYLSWVMPQGSNKITMFIDGASKEYTVTKSGNNVVISWDGGSATYEGTFEGNAVKIKWDKATGFYNHEPPGATYSAETGAVKWDLDPVGTLLDEVTYTVTFDVYPSQTALDYRARLENGEAYNDVVPAEARPYFHADGTLETNTVATLTYNDTRTPDGSQTVGFTNPDPVRTQDSTLTVNKLWEGEEPDTDSIELTVLMDGEIFHEVTLNENTENPDESWKASSFISVGIIKDGQALPGSEGHDFSFAELDDTQYHWELDAPTVRPMRIGNNIVMLIKVDGKHPAPTEADTYTIDGATYYADEQAAGLTAVNHRRSNLNLTKIVTGEDAPEDETFPFTLTVKNSKASNGSADNTDSDYYVWFSIYDNAENKTVFDANVTGATAETRTVDTSDSRVTDFNYDEESGLITYRWNGSTNLSTLKYVSVSGTVYTGNTGYYYAPSGSDIGVDMEADWNLRFTNLPSGTTYTFEEELAQNFTFISAELTEGTDSSFNGAQTTTGTIENTKTSYTVTYTNDYALTDLEITKVWEDANNQDGKRLTPEELAAKLTLAPAVSDKAPTVVDNKDNTYTITYTGLPRYNNGQEVIYTVTESEIDGYTTTGSPAEDHGTITNTHTPSTTELSVTKVWDDADDRDRLRPASVSVTLKADGEDADVEDATVTLDDSNEWSYKWEDLPEFKNGVAIEYTVQEAPVANYTTSYELDEETNTYTITNSYTPQVTSYTFNKSWDDNDNQDGVRPTSISVQLYADGTAYGEPQTVNANGQWSYTWTGLPKNSAGTAIVYTAKELNAAGAAVEDHGAYDDNYTATYSTDAISTTVTNTHNVEKTQYTVTKVWEDGGDQDGIRPTSISVQLKADGSNHGDPVTLGADNQWTYTWTELDKKSNGQVIDYSVAEISEIEGYETEGPVEAADGLSAIITNTHETEETTYTITKVWVDNDDQDGLRPTDPVKAQLYADGEAYGNPVDITLQEDGTLSYTWTDLPVNEAGTAIEYTAYELNADGEAVEDGDAYDDNYTASYETTDYSTTVTNTHDTLETYRTVTKAWADANDQDGVRPGSVSVQLYADGEAYGDPVELTADSETPWSYTWTGLPVNAAGEPIEYTIYELNADGEAVGDDEAYNDDYTATYSTTDTSTTVTNTHVPAEIKIIVSKTWEDENNQDGVRPSSVTVNLLADGEAAPREDDDATVQLSASNSWQYTWDKLPEYADGEKITYSVTEDAVTGYTTEISDPTETEEAGVYTVDVVNTHEVDKTTVTVTKVWEDNDDQDGIRPESISVQLMADGTAQGDPVDVTAEDGWTYTWEDLDVNKAGAAIEYSVDEVAVDGYETEIGEISGTAEDGYEIEITNTHEPLQTTVTVTKAWEDENDQDGIRPGSISVQLLADGEAQGTPVSVTSAGRWTYTWEDLDAYKEGELIEYSVDEVEVEGYETEIGEISGSAEDGYEIEISNTHDVDKTTVTVTKAWEDNDDQDGIRPESISVQLLADGEAQGEPVDVTAEDGWTYTWENLDVNKAGTAIEYSVDEVAVDGYDTEIGEITGSAEAGYEIEITNTHEPLQTTVTVTKTWEDENDQDGIRPDSISVQLLADEEAYGEPVSITASEDGAMTYTWEGLDAYKAGELIEYSVEEAEIEGYETEIGEITGSAEEGYEIEITNTHEVYKTTVTVTKVWEDNDNAYDSRTDVTVTLYADGETADVEDAEVELNDNNQWTYTWEDLDVNKEGTAIAYTVDEAAVEGYTKQVGQVTGDAENGFEVTITNTINNYDVTVTKTFEGIPAELIPEDFSIVVSWGETDKEKAELKPADAEVSEDKLVYTWTIKAPYNAEITVEEINADVTGFILQEPEEEPTVTVTTGTNTLPIINTYEPDLGDLKITKNLKSFAETEGQTTFVFKVIAKLGTVEVYNDVVSIDFSKAGSDSVTILDKINVGANVTVEEIYYSGSYEPDSETVWTGVIGPKTDETGAALDPVEAVFANKYNNNLNQGYGILNEYSKEAGADWTHNGSQVEEEGKD